MAHTMSRQPHVPVGSAAAAAARRPSPGSPPTPVLQGRLAARGRHGCFPGCHEKTGERGRSGIQHARGARRVVRRPGLSEAVASAKLEAQDRADRGPAQVVVRHSQKWAPMCHRDTALPPATVALPSRNQGNRVLREMPTPDAGRRRPPPGVAKSARETRATGGGRGGAAPCRRGGSTDVARWKKARATQVSLPKGRAEASTSARWVLRAGRGGCGPCAHGPTARPEGRRGRARRSAGIQG